MHGLQVAPGLELTWTPGCSDIWLHATGIPTEGSIALDEIEAPVVKIAFIGWAMKLIKEQVDERFWPVIKEPTTERPKDKYDREIAFLIEYPELIPDHWSNCTPLFQSAGRGLKLATGCLTQIRAFEYRRAATPELTIAIKADTRIPKTENEVRIETLPVFAEWQRKLDAELGEDVDCTF